MPETEGILESGRVVDRDWTTILVVLKIDRFWCASVEVGLIVVVGAAIGIAVGLAIG